MTGRLVFTDALLLDGVHAAVAHSTVVVDGNRIVAVAPGGAGGAPGTPSGVGGAVEVRPDDTVVDLGGRTLMPGMVSGHFHSTYHNVGGESLPFGLERPPAYQALRALANAQLALSRGFTSVVGASAAFDVDASLAAAIRDGVAVGPRVVPASRDLITTADSNDTVPWWYESAALGVVRMCDGPDEFRKAVRDEIKRGAQIIKVYVTGGHGVTVPKHTIALSSDELRAVVEAAHGKGRRVRAHVAHRDAILECVRLGVDIIDHGDGLDDECIDAMVAAGTFLLPSLYLPLKILELMGDAPGAGTMGFTTETGHDFAAMCAMLPRAVEAGVQIATGDDFGSSITPHGVYAEELAVYVHHAGIPALEVLRWATQIGGRLTGWGDELGTIAPGMLADLVVVDGDPSDDITLLADPSRIVAVIKDGQLVSGSFPVGTAASSGASGAAARGRASVPAGV
jgi:imidazolonepropionase-like amidohydrolase